MERVSMEPQSRSWTARHFSLAHPRGPQQADVPAFLRRLADTLTTYGEVEVQDIVFHMEIGEDGIAGPTATVYFHQTSVTDVEGR
jgi:hypothetical protein